MARYGPDRYSSRQLLQPTATQRQALLYDAVLIIMITTKNRDTPSNFYLLGAKQAADHLD